MSNNEHNFPPALWQYLQEIGAEVLNFKRAVIKKYINGTHYYKEREIIEILDDGTIKCSDEFKPTPEQQQEIIAQWQNYPRPKPAAAPIASFRALVLEKGMDPKKVWPLIDRKSGGVRMAQQRIDNADGTKSYLPWSFWSDGVWRKMECEGKIPLWKPSKKLSHKIMLHEGAKAAAFADWLVNSNEADAVSQRLAHPWAETLAEYEHWGLIGGATAAHRADYAELHREQPQEVVMLCDNDEIGAEALQTVSRHYGRTFRAIKVPPADFKKGWDIADALPEHLFSGQRWWNGNALEDLIFPATWATEPVPGLETNRVQYQLTEYFLQDWAFSLEPLAYISIIRPDRVLDEKTWDIAVRPFSNVKKTSELLHKHHNAQAVKLTYHPGAKSGFMRSSSSRELLFNTFTGTLVKPLKGDVTPFLEFMAHLFPHEQDRKEVLRWMVTLIAKPTVKMAYGLLLVSETQGVGKTTLGEKILAPLVGKHNTSFPGESVIDDKFNEWIAHKRLAVVNEIYSGHSAKTYDKLKSLVTDQDIMVNKKHQSAYTLKNWLHIMACSNSMRALKLAVDDRRWLVPKVTEETRPQSYWREFNGWLQQRHGISYILHWANEWALDNKTVAPGEIAPRTEAKLKMIEEQLSPGLLIVSDLLKFLKNDFEQGGEGKKVPVVFDAVLVDLIRFNLYQGRIDPKLEKSATIRKLAKSQGWLVSPERVRSGQAIAYYLTLDPGLASDWERVKAGTTVVAYETVDALRALKAQDGHPVVPPAQF
jgi:hypothetical protein